MTKIYLLGGFLSIFLSYNILHLEITAYLRREEPSRFVESFSSTKELIPSNFNNLSNQIG